MAEMDAAEKINIAEIFGEDVFNDNVMRERLSEQTYKELNKTIRNGEQNDEKR